MEAPRVLGFGQMSKPRRKIILPYVQETTWKLKLPEQYPAPLIFDNFKAQCISDLLKLLDENNIYVTLVPANCTDRLHPMTLVSIKLQRSISENFRSGMQTNLYK